MKIKSTSRSEQVTEEAETGYEGVSEKRMPTGKATSGSLKIQKILVPVDFSGCSLHALDYAVSFAEQFQAKLILLHVVEPGMYPENYMSISPVLDETNQNLVIAGRERLEELTKKRVGTRTPAETLVRMGRAHSEIPDTAKAMGADLIIISTHGYTGLKHVLLGSTAERVVRQAPCPVLTVRNPDSRVVERR